MRTLLLLMLCQSAFAQQADTLNRPYYSGRDMEKHLSVLVGYNGWRHHYAELGFAVNRYGRVGHHPFASACFASAEMRIGNDLLIAPKIGAWIGGGAGGMALGINLLCYTDFVHSSWRLRPEIGMGFGRWKVVYGYNIPLHRHDLVGVNGNNISVAYLLGVKTLEVIRE
jgi:hypothetical protein